MNHHPPVKSVHRLTSFDVCASWRYVKEDVVIVLFSARQLPADRELIDNSGGYIEVPFGTERTKGELGDQPHVASDPPRRASSARVAGCDGEQIDSM